MITVCYTVFDLAGEKERESSMSEFMLEAPGLIPLGIIPPLHILNEILSLGQIGGGMSPGCRWSAFEINKRQYDELVSDLQNRSPDDLMGRSYPIRSGRVIIDESLAHCNDFVEWIGRVGEKYRDQN